MTQENYNFQDLCDVVTILRGEGGCPWDREQDHHSVRKGMIEECYEVVEAIDRDDPELLREELGDVLLQVVFHADMEKDVGRFDIDDVANDECVKMIHRHPHVFGTVQVDNSDEVLSNWEVIKKEEKQRLTLAEQLRAIPPMLPALMRAQKVGRKAALDSDRTPEDMMLELSSQLAELAKNGDEARSRMGDVLLRMTSLCRLLGIEAEEELTASVEKTIDEIS
ncbi:MAG: MazG family protein [Clostridia bacterium]|nr:MazG family protein [Clostridia bacterium]